MNPPRTVMLRPARAPEARPLADMSRRLIETGLGWRYTPARMAMLIDHPQTVVLIAHDAAHIQGFAVMRFGDEHAHLLLLCVQPAQRQQGIGRRLMDWLLESGRVAGIESVELELRADNADVNDMLKDPAVKAALDAQGLTVVGGSAADFRRVLDAEAKRWGPIITRIGVKLD